MKKLSVILCSMLLVTISGPLVDFTQAAITIEWANSVTNTNAIDPEQSLGKPDGDVAHFSGSPVKFGTFSGFGNGDNIIYDSSGLASLMGVSESVLAQTDFISIEYNGSAGGFYEGSDWVFDDGVTSLSVFYTYGDDSPSTILSLGTINNDDYASFFGFTNPYGTIGDLAYILFDIDGTSSVNPFASTFSVTITAGSEFDPYTPEPDVMGRVSPICFPFADVCKGHWAYEEIKAIYDAGITKGCSQNPLKYCPKRDVTRDQMATFIVRAVEGEPPANYCGTGSPFSDVSSSSVFCKYIKRLSELGITKGCGGGKYCPKRNVKRDQMAAFLVRAVEGEPPPNYCATGSPFSDVDPATVFCKYIKRLSELGITKGCGGGKYCPKTTVKRDQMAVFLGRAFLGMD